MVAEKEEEDLVDDHVMHSGFWSCCYWYIKREEKSSTTTLQFTTVLTTGKYVFNLLQKHSKKFE